MKNNQKGFTLIELIVVIAIIGILATVMMPKFASFTDRAKEKAVMSEARAIYTACESILVETGSYPTDDDAGKKLVWKELGKDYSKDGGALTLKPSDNTFTYTKTVKGKALTATLTKTDSDNDGILEKEEITVGPATTPATPKKIK